MGNDSYGQLCDGGTTTQRTPVKTLAGVRDVALGGKHSLILKTDDSLWACGSNEFGQLGNGGTRNAQTPVQIMDGVMAIAAEDRSEEHTSELQSLMRISYAVFCLKNKKITQ